MLSVRKAALNAVVRILEDGAYTNLALKEAIAGISQDEVPYMTALVNETIVRSSYMDYILAVYCKRQKRLIRNLLRMAGTELLFMSTPAYAVLNESVALCRQIGKKENAGFVNAILRRIDRERDALPLLPEDPVDRLSVLYGFPKFLIREWIETYGEQETEALLSFPPLGTEIRAQYPYTTEDLLSSLPVHAEPCLLDPNCLRLTESFDTEHNELFQSGKMTVQNEGAMLICRATGDLRGKRVLDACAAPGGKTAYLASLSENTAELFAWELHPHRKALLDATLSRLHVKANTACADASVLREDCLHAFDAVLLDVPCSGFGLLSDKPDVRLNKSEETVDSLVKTQKRLLDVCSQYVKPGGTLVYATCTISKRENEDRVRAFLATHEMFRCVEERQLLPTRDGTNGFYYAKLIGG